MVCGLKFDLIFSENVHKPLLYRKLLKSQIYPSFVPSVSTHTLPRHWGETGLPRHHVPHVLLLQLTYSTGTYISTALPSFSYFSISSASLGPVHISCSVKIQENRKTQVSFDTHISFIDFFLKLFCSIFFSKK